jgi:superfamily II DNA/RNA helicase
MFMYDVPLKFYAAYPGTRFKQEYSKIDSGIDVLITTLDRLAKHRNNNRIFLSNCQTLIIDELDTLLDAGYHKHILGLLMPLLGKAKSDNIDFKHPVLKSDEDIK